VTRAGEVERKTKETQVTVRLDLDGSGAYDVQTPNPFLTHMVETWTRYAGFDVKVRAAGDLDHHIVEDTGIALGQAFRAAFALAPCQRIAYDVVPMDDALVLVAVDLVDRPYYEGQLPIPLWEHFLRSFAMEARINLHVDVLRGRDTHHAVEAAIKAFARSLRRALEPRDEEISTKGTVQAKVAGAHTPQPAYAAPAPAAPPAEAPAPIPKRVHKPRATPVAPKPLSIEEEELMAALERDPSEDGWSWRQGAEEAGTSKALKDLSKRGLVEVRNVGKDGRPRIEARLKKRSRPQDPGTIVAPPREDEAGGAHVKPESLAAANKEVRAGKPSKRELPEVKAARERDREIHGERRGDGA
jgi:imidazoleglycerol-phosphate dehydratase